MNNGTYNKNCLNKNKKDNKNDDEIVVKQRSPYLYNRSKLPSLNDSKTKFDFKSKKELEPIIPKNNISEKNDSVIVDILNKKLNNLEKQLQVMKLVLNFNIEIK